MPPDLHRRSWLAGLAASGLAVRWSLAAGPKPDAGEAEMVRAVGKRAQEAGLGSFRVNRTTHYLAIGDAPDDFRERALSICEGLALDFLDHFNARGFAVERPERRLAVVLLASSKSFGAFLDEPAGGAVGGQYDRDTNRLVVFDNRGEDRGDRARAETANLVALVHEATHQLTYNSGLLNREGDVPLCVAEGLAMYAETRRPSGRSVPGQPNPERVKALAIARKQGAEWTSLPSLLTGDAILLGEDGEPAQQASYAQAWLMVHDLIKTAKWLPGFRAYLKAIQGRKDDSRRLEDAREHLGDLNAIDEALRKHAERLLGGR